MYQKIKTYEDETLKRKTKSSEKKRKKVSRPSLKSMNDGERSEKTNKVVMLDVIEVAIE